MSLAKIYVGLQETPIDEIISLMGKCLPGSNSRTLMNSLKATKLEDAHPEMNNYIFVIHKQHLKKLEPGLNSIIGDDKHEIESKVFINELSSNVYVMKRSEAEYNKNYIQITGCYVIRNSQNGSFLMEHRTTKSTDSRICGSLGFPGGHIYSELYPYTIKNDALLYCLSDKISKEIGNLPEITSENFEQYVYTPMSLLRADDEHLGLVAYLSTEGRELNFPENLKSHYTWMDIHELRDLYNLNHNNIDTWSTLILRQYGLLRECG